MENGIFKYVLIVIMITSSLCLFSQEEPIRVSDFRQHLTDLDAQSKYNVLDHNQEKCAILKIETPIPTEIKCVNRKNEVCYERRKDDEENNQLWLWVSADVKNIILKCDGKLLNYQFPENLSPAKVYTFKITTKSPLETNNTRLFTLKTNSQDFRIQVDAETPKPSQGNSYSGSLKVGKHKIKITSEWYKPKEFDINLKRSTLGIDTIIRLEENFEEVKIDSKFSDLDFQVNNAPATLYGNAIRLKEGKNTLIISKKDYSSYTKDITVTLGKPISTISVELEPQFIDMEIVSQDNNVEIWVDNVLKGVRHHKERLSFGKHKIEGRKQSYQSFSEVIEVNSKTSTSLTIPSLKPIYGEMRLQVIPANVEVRLDGIVLNGSRGEYQEQKVLIGNHGLRLSCEDYKTQEEQIIIDQNSIFTKTFELIKVPTGIVTIETDPEITIYTVDQDFEEIPRGQTSWTGKLPVGENKILLKKPKRDATYNIISEYIITVTEGKNQKFKLKYFRELVIKPSVPGTKISLKPEIGREKIVKANKKVRVEPQLYDIILSKDKYNEYSDRIDFSLDYNTDVVLRPTLNKLGQHYTTKVYSQQINDNKLRHKYYNYSGAKFFSFFDGGYTYDIASNNNLLSLGLFSYRYKMFGFSLLNFEAGANILKEPFLSELPEPFRYKPNIKFFFPLGKATTFNMYVGSSIDVMYLWSQINQNYSYTANNVKFTTYGGLSFRFSAIPALPLELFAEYHYPINSNFSGNGFMVGAHLYLGVDR